jgi:ZIP family zinc transporter
MASQATRAPGLIPGIVAVAIALLALGWMIFGTRAAPPPVALGVLTACSTLLGGLVALHLERHMNAIAAFSGGVVVGVAMLMVLPEAAELLDGRADVLGVASAGGFFSFFFMEKLFLLRDPRRGEPGVGVMAAAGLSVHSFIDGLGIGLSLHAGARVAALVLLAVVAHDFVDGVNTVVLVVGRGNPLRRGVQWLLVDAAAPIAGVLVGAAYAPSHALLGGLLAFYVGFFIHVGAADLLPRAFARPSAKRFGATLAGLALVVLLSRIVR